MLSARAARSFFLLTIILSSAIVATGPLQDPDLWWHIKTGEIILTTRSLPQSDIYSYTALNRPWRAYSWLPEIVFSLVSRIGIFYLILLRILILVSVGIALFFSSERLISNPQISALLVFTGWCSAYPLWELRPHIFSMLFLVLVVSVVVFEYLDKKFVVPAGVLPLIFLVWANCHIYFVWGLVIFGGFLFFVFLKKRSLQLKYILIFAASLLATLINPYGAGVWAQFWELANHSWTWSWVMEMAKPYPWDTRVVAFWFYVVWSLVILWFFRRKLNVFFIFLLTFSFAFSMTALRHIFMYPIVSIVSIAAVVADSTSKSNEEIVGVKLPPTVLTGRVALVFVVVLAFILSFRIYRDFKKPIADSVPVMAVDFIEKNEPPSPMGNYFDFGGYLIYRLWPRYKVFIDGRTQVYVPAFLDDYTVFQSRGPYNIDEIKSVVDRYGIKSIIWASDHPLAEVLDKIFPKVLYKDKTAVILAR